MTYSISSESLIAAALLLGTLLITLWNLRAAVGSIVLANAIEAAELKKMGSKMSRHGNGTLQMITAVPLTRHAR